MCVWARIVVAGGGAQLKNDNFEYLKHTFLAFSSGAYVLPSLM